MEFLILPFGYPIFQGGLKWPSDTISYFDESGYTKPLNDTLTKLEASGLKLRLVKSTKERAQLIIKASPSNRCGGKHQVACVSHIGYKPFEKSYVFLPPPGQVEAKLPEVIAHELGHVAGLRHKEGCSVMNKVLDNFKCKAFSLSTELKYELGESCLEAWMAKRNCRYETTDRYLCGPTPGDIKHLIRIYGGELEAGYSPYCKNTRSFQLTPPTGFECRGLERLSKYCKRKLTQLKSKTRA